MRERGEREREREEMLREGWDPTAMGEAVIRTISVANDLTPSVA